MTVTGRLTDWILGQWGVGNEWGIFPGRFPGQRSERTQVGKKHIDRYAFPFSPLSSQ